MKSNKVSNTLIRISAYIIIGICLSIISGFLAISTLVISGKDFLTCFFESGAYLNFGFMVLLSFFFWNSFYLYFVASSYEERENDIQRFDKLVREGRYDSDTNDYERSFQERQKNQKFEKTYNFLFILFGGKNENSN